MTMYVGGTKKKEKKIFWSSNERIIAVISIKLIPIINENYQQIIQNCC